MNEETQRRTNVSLLLIFGISGFVFATAGCGFLYFLWNSTAAQTVRGALRDDVLIGVTLLWWALVVICLAGCGYAIGRAYTSIEDKHNRARVFFSPNGVIPNWAASLAMAPSETHSHERSLAAIASGPNVTVRVTGSTIKALTDGAGTEIDPALDPPHVSVEDVTSVNLRTDPHIFIVGATGSGKSTATYALADSLNRAGAEFIICERWRRTWYTMAHATTTETIEEAIRATYIEFIMRQRVLDDHDAQHMADVRDGPGPLVLLIEEFADWWAAFKKLDKERVIDCRDKLQELAREGRKTYISMILVSQSPVSDVLDSEVRKNMNVLLFRSEFTVDRTWGVPPWADLPTLPPGTAYSVRHGALVEFPLTVQRPQLRLSEAYREPVGTMRRYIDSQIENPPLQLSRDATRDGSGVFDLPDGATEVLPGVVPGVSEVRSEVLSHSNTPAGGSKRPSREPYSVIALRVFPDDLREVHQVSRDGRRIMWDAFHSTNDNGLYSLRGTHALLWPNIRPGGQKHRVLSAVIAEEAKRHGYTLRVVDGRGVRLEKRT